MPATTAGGTLAVWPYTAQAKIREGSQYKHRGGMQTSYSVLSWRKQSSDTILTCDRTLVAKQYCRKREGTVRANRLDAALVDRPPRCRRRVKLYRSSHLVRCQQNDSGRARDTGREDGLAAFRFSMGVRDCAA